MYNSEGNFEGKNVVYEVILSHKIFTEGLQLVYIISP